MDGTLTPPRKELDSDLIPALRELAKISEIGIVTGSDHNYVLQQMGLLMENSGDTLQITYPPPVMAQNIILLPKLPLTRMSLPFKKI